MSTDSTAAEQRLTVVADELQAQMICALLEDHGIRSTQRRAHLGGVNWGEIDTGMSGARDVFVRPEDLDTARELLQEALDHPVEEHLIADTDLDRDQRQRAANLKLWFGLAAAVFIILPALIPLVYGLGFGR